MHGPGETWAVELPAAVKSLARRGPDDQGIWIGAEEGAIGLGHRRLSILQAGDATVRQRVWLLVASLMWFRRWMPVP